MDVFIPHKSSKSGRKYGFVRFPTWSEANNAIEKLNGAWLFDHRLDVHFARLNVNATYWKRANSSTHGASQRRCDERSLSREASPNRNAVNDFNNRYFTKTDKRNIVDPTKPGCNQVISDGEQVVLELPVQDLKWLEASVVALVRSPLAIQALQQRLVLEEFSPLSFYPMGGSWFLIRFQRKESVLNLLAEGNSWLEEWFYWIKPWSKELISDERFAWIRISRIPLHAWNEETFKQIGNHVGKYILADECSVNKLCLDFARILVVVNKELSVRNTMEIRVNDAKFNINLEVENNSEFRLNQLPFTVQGRNSNFPASATVSNPMMVTVQAKESVQKEAQILQAVNDDEPPLECGEVVTSEKGCQQEYDEMVATLNRDKENGGNFELKFVDEILSTEVTTSSAEETALPLIDPSPMTRKNPNSDSDMPSEENRALCLVQYGKTIPDPTEEQMIQQSEDTQEENNQVTIVNTKKNKKFISASDLQSIEDKSGKKNSISVKRKEPKNRKKTNFSRKKENKQMEYYSDTPSYFEEEISDEDIRNRNRMLRREAQATMELAKMLGLSMNADEEDIIRSLLEAEIEDMARNICRDQ